MRVIQTEPLAVDFDAATPKRRIRDVRRPLFGWRSNASRGIAAFS